MAEWDVPGYTELKALGSGGFGDVVLARHNVSGTLVAIKYLHGDLLDDQEFAEMFRGEATVLASLDDPNVVRLYEYVESPSGAAIVMELIDGVSLREILTHQGKTTAEAALVVLQGSLLGLAAAHRHGVVHRDYKPENVLVDGGGASKLTDFGIAARAGDRPVPAGTLAYAAPEQFASAPARPASDVYAATATFYECLTGHPPFRGESAAALLLQHRSEPVPLEPVPVPLRPLVAAGMAKDPGLRPTDANTFVAALRAAASGAYGQDWEDRGRSHLGEAALLLAALWPSGEPPAVQGTTVERISLFRRVGFRRIGVMKAAIVAGVAIAVVAAGTALAATGSLNRPSASNQPITVQPVSLQPSSPPAVTGVSPPRGITAGGTGATITGTGLGGTTGVSLGGSHSLLPAVTGVSPAGGPPAGGTSVTITGTGLAGATRVSFRGATAKVTADSGTQITVTSPAGASTVDITVTTPAGTSAATAADHFTYTAGPAPPAVTGVSPAGGPAAGGTSVAITGTGLSGATGVSFGGTSAKVTADSSTQITATSPPGKGTVDITVTTPAGASAATPADNFTYTAAPPPPPLVISGVSPASGPAAGGTSVAITGTGLSGATGVSFGGTPATVTADSSTQITATSPPGTGTVDITVTTPAGTSAATAADHFAYTAATTKMVVVANVVGDSQTVATSTLQGQGLTVTTSSTSSCDATDKGNVVTQNPPSGTSVSVGTAVAISICAATTKTVVVANVVGDSQTVATSTLQGQGLAVTTSSTGSCDATDNGNVVTQAPAAGMSVSAGASVNISICAATVKTVVVDNVVGDSQTVATSTLQGQGLAVTTSSTGSCDATDNGNVVTQAPAAGMSVSAGASVNISICAATVKTVVVDNVVGDSQALATSTLQGQGLTVTTSSTSSCDATDNGNVVTQNPPSGTSVSVGTAVAISICAATVKTVVVANVVGDSQALATSTLQGQGLMVTTSSVGCTTHFGTVATQDPAGGMSVSAGSNVTIGICTAELQAKRS